MRLIVRVNNSGNKMDHLAQKHIHQVMASRSNINPTQQQQNKFEVSYLVTHNTKVLRATYQPKTNQTDDLILHISKLINIADQFLLLKLPNKFYNHQNNKQLSGNRKKQNQNPKKKLQQNNYGGINFTQQSIKYVRLVKGFTLPLYNINLDSSTFSQFSKQQQNPENMKTLQVCAQILSTYYSSKQYKQIIIQNKQSQVRVSGNLGRQKFGVSNAIQQQDQEQDQQPKARKVQNLNFEEYNMEDAEFKKTYDPTISKYYGELFKIRKPPLKDYHYYYVLDPYEGYFKEFESKDKFPNSPLEVLSLNFILDPSTDIEKIKPKDVSWYMKKDLSYFSVEFTVKSKKQKYKFGCCVEQTVDKWIKALKSCKQKSFLLKCNPKLLSNLVKNDTILIDRKQALTPLKKKTSSNYDLQNIFSKYSDDPQDSVQKDIEERASKQQLCGLGDSSKHKQEPSVKFQDEPPVQPRFSSNKSSSTANSTGQEKKQFDDVKQDDKSTGLRFLDFKFLKQLGEGSFGQVFLAQSTKNKQLYALKAFKKKKLIMNKQIKFAISQINILKQINHPYVISLHFTFQTPNYIYLGLDFCGGKDLSHHLIQEVAFSQDDCRFYAAELVLAIEYLHSKDIIYRDLKPENILLEENGHLRIIDFGLSKQTDNNIAKSFCGSPAYISPEMLKKNGVGKQCDLFSLGAVIYEMIVGQPPFYSQDIKELYDNIAKAKLKFPKVVSEKARSLLQGLLRKNPKDRLGSKNFDQIKNHQFFKGIDWELMMKKQVEAPRRATIEIIQQKQESDRQFQETQLLKVLHDDFDYTESTFRINRFKNFSFIRQGQGL